jgi:hypothetical protein
MFGLISGDTLGECWTQDCCFIQDYYKEITDLKRACTKDDFYNETIESKLSNLIYYSKWQSVFEQIDYDRNKYMSDNYRPADDRKDIEYKSLYRKHFKNDILIYKNISEMIEKYGYWNYERLCRNIGLKYDKK